MTTYLLYWSTPPGGQDSYRVHVLHLDAGLTILADGTTAPPDTGTTDPALLPAEPFPAPHAGTRQTEITVGPGVPEGWVEAALLYSNGAPTSEEPADVQWFYHDPTNARNVKGELNPEPKGPPGKSFASMVWRRP